MFEFHRECTVLLKKGEHPRILFSKMNFIRQEDVVRFGGKCDGMKLVMPTNFNQLAVVSAYFSGQWWANLLDQMEPVHSE